MGLKGGRLIIVRDLLFRWTFSGKKDRYGDSPRTAHVAVQEDMGRPGKMVAWLTSQRWVSAEAHDGDTGHLQHRAMVTPRDVRRIVEAALGAGWDPASREPYEAAAGLELTDYMTVRRT